MDTALMGVSLVIVFGFVIRRVRRGVPCAMPRLIAILLVSSAIQFLAAISAMPRIGWVLVFLLYGFSICAGCLVFKDQRASKPVINSRLQAIAVLLSWIVGLGIVLQVRLFWYPKATVASPSFAEVRDLLLKQLAFPIIIAGIGLAYFLQSNYGHKLRERLVAPKAWLDQVSRLFLRITDGIEEKGIKQYEARGVTIIILLSLSILVVLGGAGIAKYEWRYSIGFINVSEALGVAGIALLAAVGARLGEVATLSVKHIKVRLKSPLCVARAWLVIVFFLLTCLSGFRSDLGVALTTSFAVLGMVCAVREWSRIPGKRWGLQKGRRVNSGKIREKLNRLIEVMQEPELGCEEIESKADSGNRNRKCPSVLALLVIGVAILLVVGFIFSSSEKGRFGNWINPWQFTWTPECRASGVLGDNEIPGYSSCVVSVADYQNESRAQVARALTAIDGGGLFGRGFADSESSMVPAFKTDFIFVALWSKLGGLITLGSVLCFIVMGWLVATLTRTRKSAEKQGLLDRTHALWCAGLAGYLMLQPSYILLASLGVLPHSGITVPFLAWGANSATALSVMIVVAVLPLLGTSQHPEIFRVQPRKTKFGLIAGVFTTVAGLISGIFLPYRTIMPFSSDAGLGNEGVRAIINSRSRKAVLVRDASNGRKVELRRSTGEGKDWVVVDNTDHDATTFSGLLTLPEFDQSIPAAEVHLPSPFERVKFRPEEANKPVITVDLGLQKKIVELISDQPMALENEKMRQAVMVVEADGAIRAAGSAPLLKGAYGDRDLNKVKEITKNQDEIRFSDSNATSEVSPEECGRLGADHCFRVVLREDAVPQSAIGTDEYRDIPASEGRLVDNHLTETKLRSGPVIAWLIAAAYLHKSKQHTLDDQIRVRHIPGLSEAGICASNTLSVRDSLRNQCGSALWNVVDIVGWDSVIKIGEMLGMKNTGSKSPAQIEIAQDAQGKGSSRITPEQLIRLILLVENGKIIDPYVGTRTSPVAIMTVEQAANLREEVWRGERRVDISHPGTYNSPQAHTAIIRGENGEHNLAIVTTMGPQEAAQASTDYAAKQLDMWIAGE